jgi:hypothetical protein
MGQINEVKSLHATPMTILRYIARATRQGCHKVMDLRRRRREQRRHQELLWLMVEYDVLEFLLPPDPQLPPKPSDPPRDDSVAPSSRPIMFSGDQFRKRI